MHCKKCAKFVTSIFHNIQFITPAHELFDHPSYIAFCNDWFSDWLQYSYILDPSIKGMKVRGVITLQWQLQTYCETKYAWSGVNQIWILKDSKNLFWIWNRKTFPRIRTIIFLGDYRHYRPLLFQEKWKKKIFIYTSRSFKNWSCWTPCWFCTQVLWSW